MAWSAVPISNVGDLIDADWLNTYLRDNFNFASTHVHSGAAGDGSATPGPLTYVDATDAAAPSAPAAGKTRLYTTSGRWRYRPNGGSDTLISTEAHVHNG